MKTTDLWAGKFGDSYIERNRLDFKPRMPFWESAIQFMTPSTVFEFGCNIGLNLRAIHAVSPNVQLFGADINAKAAEEARQAGFEVQHIGPHGIAGLYEPGSMELTFTSGVLIHVAPDDLERTMRSLIELSGRYVLAVEYHAEQEQEVEYRGQKGALWKRNYGKLYQDLGLQLLSEGLAAGWDDQVTYYLLQKSEVAQ